ncbi:MAG: hypothetical protein M0D54_11015 [Hyphomonadaceae bacterium JAD_PAG50586_4]|nr:MAG: hypothetical protein M0D54_11015 [Hyphomonadaceae bacterium JAD_PAG50586_4]
MRFYETSAYWALPVGETNSFVAAGGRALDIAYKLERVRRGGGEVRLIAATSLPADGAFVNFELATPWARRRL